MSLAMALLAAALSFAALAVIFVPLERAFPARATQGVLRPALAVDLAFFLGQYLLWNSLSLALIDRVQRALAVGASAPWRPWVAARPAWLQCVAAVVLGDVLVYWFHRACHRVDVLWRFHAVHHSAEHLDWVAAHREHPFDGIATQLCANLPAVLLGFDTAAIAGFVMFRGLWAIFLHSNVRVPLGLVGTLLGSPALHRWHHARVARTQHNFANVAPWLDLLFGTHHDPTRDDEAHPIGLVEPWPEGYLAQLARPFRR